MDLAHHGCIEAHAGTGKTYTIVKLVLRMLETVSPPGDLQENSYPVDIRNILLVTFTEKAAGELKKRIRQELETHIAHHPEGTPLRSHLENCCNTMHEALIGTIHGVCLRLLQTWPFESGVPFETEITDDGEGLDATLRESMRTDWQDEATCIPWALRLLTGQGLRIERRHYDLLLQTARELLDDQFTVLDRSSTEGHTLATLQEEYLRLLRKQDEYRDSFHRLITGLITALEEAQASRKMSPERNALCAERLPELYAMLEGNRYDLKIIAGPCKAGRKGIYITADLKKIPGIAAADECCGEISRHPFTRTLQRKKAIEEYVTLALIGDGAELLARRWKTIKKSAGLISYPDMLQLMHRAVSERPAFVALLRGKLKFAIIDEFQDTSRLQWEVFRRLFLENDQPGDPRLFIVGDPKQSIYAFQGADVGSYLDAKSALEAGGNTTRHLAENYRSCETTILGYNAVLTTGSDENDWFLFDDRSRGIFYTADEAARVPPRPAPSDFPLNQPAVQAIPLAGTVRQRIHQLTEDVCFAVKNLAGTRLSLPDGDRWNNRTLEYGDFAVIVETHALAEPFLDAFRRERIPVVKYKMEGVFQSSIARAVYTLLQTVDAPSDNQPLRLAALLTPFFNRSPAYIDPEHDLEPCSDLHCSGDNACIAHALDEWIPLAARSRWARLFERIIRRTGIEQRLLRLADGERQLADLRQITDYCIGRLFCDNFTLTRLIEHLRGLIDGVKHTGQDSNLHVLETQRSSVRILTIHAAKGLEFPVVFAVTGSTRTNWRSPGVLRYTAQSSTGRDRGRHCRITPFLSVKDIRVEVNGATAEQRSLLQARQERRRLLYVALTRAQALLFLPLHCASLSADDTGFIQWSECPLPEKSADRDLTPRLQALLDADSVDNPVSLFNRSRFIQAAPENPPDISAVSCSSIESCPDINGLELFRRICRQTSYTYLSREMHTSREIDRSEEAEDDNNSVNLPVESPLPGGRKTGDALHCTLEEILRMDDATVPPGNPSLIEPVVRKYLKRNGILAGLEPGGTDGPPLRNACTAAARCVLGALTTGINLPGNEFLAGGIAAIAPENRIPEMEFLLHHDPHWIHGFMDVVFRMPAAGSLFHPWRYFVLDWKSDTLPRYDNRAITECISIRHYDLQARLYCHALDTYLRGVIGAPYDPAQHLGGAVYLFLREFEHVYSDTATVWTYAASPGEDARYVTQLINGRYRPHENR